jgi:hypothetical protein
MKSYKDGFPIVVLQFVRVNYVQGNGVFIYFFILKINLCMIFKLYNMIHCICSTGAVMVEGVEGVTKVFVCPWNSGVVDFRKRFVSLIHKSYGEKM